MKQKKYRKTKIMFRLIFALLLLFFLASMAQIGRKYSNNNEKIEKIHFSGTYQKSEGAKKHTLSEKNYPRGDTYKNVILKGHFNREIPEDKVLFLFMSGMRAEILVNGNRIYEFGYKGSIPSAMKSGGYEWAHVKSGGIELKDDVEIRLNLVYAANSVHVYKNLLKDMYVGHRYEFMIRQIKKNIIKIAIAVFIMMLGFLFMGMLQILCLMKIGVPSNGWPCGMLMITGGGCLLIDYQYITLLFENGIFINALDLVLQALICEFLLYYLKSYLISPRFRFLSGCFIVIWSGMCTVYFILQGNGIADGAQVILWYIPIVVIMLSIVAVFLLLDYRKHSDKRIRALLHSCFLLTVAAVVEEIHFFMTRTYWVIVLEIGLLIFTTAQMKRILIHIKQNVERARRSKELENELIQSRVTIMISQIQPHFLYNTLTSIQELCMLSPEKARQAISWFSQFLRGNMDSLSTTNLIPFEKELQHVKNYLKLEKVRFESLLNIEYQIEVTDFLVPALFLQPIVENAVHYGISKKEDGGTVWLSTYEKDQGICISVRDNGFGIRFDEKGNIIYHDKKKQSHLGIENVKKRIKVQCGGSLTIMSSEGHGTEILIYIPKER